MGWDTGSNAIQDESAGFGVSASVCTTTLHDYIAIVDKEKGTWQGCGNGEFSDDEVVFDDKYVV